MDLKNYQDIKYQEFTRKITNTKYPILGIRIPVLRKIAKNINYLEYKESNNLSTYENIMLLGMLIPKIKDEKERIKAIKEYIKYIDCWSLCDTFCSNLKFINNNLDKYFNFIIKYLEKKKTYYIRFGVVMLLKYAKEEKYWDEIFRKLILINNNDYYVQMAIAWLLCEMAVYNKKRVLDYSKNLDKNIRKMLEQKMRDSYRI